MLSEMALRNPQPDSYFSACSSKSAARTEPLTASRLRISLVDRARMVIQAAVVRFGLAQRGGRAAWRPRSSVGTMEAWWAQYS